MFEHVFYNKVVDTVALLEYGFCGKEKEYTYTTTIMNDMFDLTVTIDASGTVQTAVVDRETGDPYTLYESSSEGAFIGDVRQSIYDVLQDIGDCCCSTYYYKQGQTNCLVQWARGTFGDELEFLWPKYPNFGVLRRKDSQKWYAIIMVIPKNKLGLPSDEVVEIVDIKVPHQQMGICLENPHIYPGWHMNKKTWVSIILDGSISDDQLFSMVKDSYKLGK